MPNALDQSGANNVKISSLATTPSAAPPGVSARVAVQGDIALGKAVSNLSDMFDRMSMPYDQANGAKAVTRDDNGNVQVGWRMAFTANDTAYNNAAQQAGVAEMRNKVEEDLQALRIQHDGDPIGFQKAADQYTKTLGKKADPLLAPHIIADAERIGSQHFQGMTQKNFQIDTNRQMETLQYRRKAAAEELEALALQGGTGSDEFKAKLSEYQAASAALVANKNFGFTQEQNDYEAKVLDGKVQSNVAVGMTRDILAQQGPDAARKWVSDHFNDPNLNMTARDRNAARNLAMAEINKNVQQNAGDRRILKEEISLLKKRFDGGEDVSTDEVNDYLSRAAALGDGVSVRSVINMSTAAEAAKMFRSAPTIQDKANLIRSSSLTPGGTPAGALPGLVQAVIRKESSGNPNAESGAGAAGLMQIMPGTAREIARATGITDLAGKSDAEVKAWLKGNPEQNVKMGTWYLNQQLQKFGGDTAAALVAYNAGPGVAQKWIASGKNDAMLPAETRNYKEVILGRLAMGPDPTGPIIANNRLVTGNTSYLDFAGKYMGFTQANPSQRAALANFIKEYAGFSIDPAKTPWCAAYVSAVLGSAGVKGASSLRALDFLKFGQPTTQPVSGDLVVFDWKDGNGHVGFVEAMENRNGKMYVKVVGGNQGHKVTSEWFSTENVVGYRRPPAIGVGPEHALPVTSKMPDGSTQYAYADAAMATAMRKEASSFVQLHFPTLESSIKKGIMPSTEDVQALIDMVAFSGNKSLMDKTRTLLSAAGDGQKIAGLSPDMQNMLLERLDQQEAAGTSIAMQEYNNVLRANAKASQKDWHDDPMMAAQKHQKVVLTELDLTKPETIQARAKQASEIAAQNGMPALVPFTKGEIGAIQSYIAAGDGKSAQALLGSLHKTLPAEQFSALLSDQDIQKSLIGLSRSDDPQKMSAAFSILDAEKQRDPLHFAEKFGAKAETDLALWQDKRQYMTPEAIMKEMRRADDPAEKARKEMRSHEAHELTKKMTVNDTVKALDPSWFFRAAAPTSVSHGGHSIDMPGLLMTEYKRQFEAAYVDTGSPEVAQRLAAERVKKVWGKSDINGGEMMRRAPELYYPPVDGKHDYIQEQLDRDVKAAILERFGKKDDQVSTARTSDYAQIASGYAMTDIQTAPERSKVMKVDQASDNSDETFRSVMNAPKKIVADHQTEADIAAGRPPSYAVVVRYDDGTYDTLLNKEGKPLRFAADPHEAVSQHTAVLELRQQQAQTLRKVTADATMEAMARGF